MERITKNEFIRFLIDEGALRFGNFTLKSGMKSPFFINIGDICSGQALRFLGRALARHISENFNDIDILFGPPYKGITMIATTAIACRELYNKDVYTCYNRKEKKGHGEKGMFVGREPKPGDRVLVIDDVLSTGGTKVEAIQLIESVFDIKIAGVAVCVDRRTRGADAGLGDYPLSSIVNLTEIAEYLDTLNDPHTAMLKQFYEEKYEG